MKKIDKLINFNWFYRLPPNFNMYCINQLHIEVKSKDKGHPATGRGGPRGSG
jgi:hypothetical protein